MTSPMKMTPQVLKSKTMKNLVLSHLLKIKFGRAPFYQLRQIIATVIVTVIIYDPI
jgi:hypothetical protein